MKIDINVSVLLVTAGVAAAAAGWFIAKSEDEAKKAEKARREKQEAEVKAREEMAAARAEHERRLQEAEAKLAETERLRELNRKRHEEKLARLDALAAEQSELLDALAATPATATEERKELIRKLNELKAKLKAA